MKAPISWNIFGFYCRKFVVIIAVSRLYVHMSNPYMISFIAQNQKGSSRFRHFCWVDITDGPRHNLNMRDMKFFNFTQRQRTDLAPAAWPGWTSGPAAGSGGAGSSCWSRWEYQGLTCSPDFRLTRRIPCWPGQRELAVSGWVVSHVACESARQKSRSQERKIKARMMQSDQWADTKNTCRTKANKIGLGKSMQRNKRDCKNLLLAQIHTFNLRQRSFTSSSTHRDSKQSEPKPKIRAAQTARLNKPTSQTQGRLR